MQWIDVNSLRVRSRRRERRRLAVLLYNRCVPITRGEETTALRMQADAVEMYDEEEYRISTPRLSDDNNLTTQCRGGEDWNSVEELELVKN